MLQGSGRSHCQKALGLIRAEADLSVRERIVGISMLQLQLAVNVKRDRLSDKIEPPVMVRTERHVKLHRIQCFRRRAAVIAALNGKRSIHPRAVIAPFRDLTTDLIINEAIVTTEARAKEIRKTVRKNDYSW